MGGLSIGLLVWFFSLHVFCQVFMSSHCFKSAEMGARISKNDRGMHTGKRFGVHGDELRFVAEVPGSLRDAVWESGKQDFDPGVDEMQRLVGLQKRGDVMDLAVSLNSRLKDVPRMSIRDNRTLDMVTGKPVSATRRKHAEVPIDVLRDIAGAAIEVGLDPYTELARGLQETGLDAQSWNMNVFHLLDPTEYLAGKVSKESTQKDLFKAMMGFVQEKNRIARSLGKKSEEEILQAYNGYGTVTPQNNEYQTDSLYGVDLPIDFNKTPVYG